MAVELVEGAGGRGLVDDDGTGALKERIAMMNGGMARRLEALEARVEGTTQTEEQRAAAARDSEQAFWGKMADLGKRLQGMDAPTAEQLKGASVAELVARLVVPGPVAADLVTEALRARLVWLEERGEGDDHTAALVRLVLAETEGEDRRE